MSLEMYVLSNRQLGSIDAWQRAIDAEGFHLRLSTETPFASLRGFLPAWWNDKQAGFECDHWPVGDVVETSPQIDLRGPWAHALAFRWGADLNACHGANMAAAAYARATDGVVFEPQAGVIWSPAEAVEHARAEEKTLPAFEAALQDMVRRIQAKGGL